MSAKGSSSAFPTNALHSALIGIVLSLAVFRFFIQGKSRSIRRPGLLAVPGSAGRSIAVKHCREVLSYLWVCKSGKGRRGVRVFCAEASSRLLSAR